MGQAAFVKLAKVLIDGFLSGTRHQSELHQSGALENKAHNNWARFVAETTFCFE